MTDDVRLRQLLDRVEIQERKAAYLRAADESDPDRMVAHFTDDCRAVYFPGQTPLVGREALRAYYNKQIGTVISSSHHLSNVEITFADADTAHMRAYLYSWQRYAAYPERTDRHCWARYLDTWVRTPDGWQQSALVYLLANEETNVGTQRVAEYLSSEAWRTGIA
jgi:uncharacterized protein (TIGR02246 family)